MRLPKLSILGLFAVIAAVAGAQTFSPNNPSVLTPGAPFRGDWVGRSERTLADGTLVVHEVHGRVARDSQGRFRQEEEAGAGVGGKGSAGTSSNQDIRYIVIDPVAHTQVRWASTSQDATLLPSGGANLRVPFPFPLLGWPATRSALDQPQPGAAADMITITDLGQKTTDGLVTEGTRTTTIVPAGKLGNDRPLTIVQDVWISRILNLVVLDTIDDPLIGKQTFEIKGITRTEPDAALFAVPDGYQVRQFPGLNAGVLGAVLPPISAPTPTALSNFRPVQGVVPDRQNYVVLDEGVWAHARRDLADLRLFTGNTEVPYALTLERSSESAQKSEAQLLKVGPVNNGPANTERVGAAKSGAAHGAEFVIDMAGVTVCDGVELRLADSAKNFVARASVQGLRAASDPLGTDLGGSVIYDLSNEGLGADFTVKFRQATFPFLRVRVTEISPDQVMRAIAINSSAHAGGWTPVSMTLPIEQAGKTTVVTWSANAGVPVSRVMLTVDPSQTNFWRDIEVLTPNGGTVTNTSVHRVHMARDGNVAESDSLAIDLPYEAWGGFQIVIENGDEPPLKISAAKGYFYERRMYFDPHGSTSVSLYSGNSRLGTPAYEYSRLFHADENAAVATLGLDAQNPNYRGRVVPPQQAQQ